MPKLSRNWGPLHPVVEETERLARTDLPRERQLELYHFLKLNRMTEDRLSNLYRQGKVVGGLYSSRGQEAVSVGSAYAMEPQDVVGPLIRNLGTYFVRGVQPREVMMQYMARADGPTGGKDVNTHFGDLSRGLVAPISMLGSLIPVMTGVALAARMQGKDLVALTYIGDGGTSTGDFHEGLNFAAVLNVPLVLIAESRCGSRTSSLGRRPTASPASWWTATTCWRSTRARSGRSTGRAAAAGRP
jgi:TPP-dependent pyruvate/acetoin dehydrogenase alpha subunit